MLQKNVTLSILYCKKLILREENQGRLSKENSCIFLGNTFRAKILKQLPSALMTNPGFCNVCAFNLNEILLCKWRRLSNVLGKKILILVYELPSTIGAWVITKETPPKATFSAVKKRCSFAPYFMTQDKMLSRHKKLRVGYKISQTW